MPRAADAVQADGGTDPNASHAEDDKQAPKRYDKPETAAAAAPVKVSTP